MRLRMALQSVRSVQIHCLEAFCGLNMLESMSEIILNSRRPKERPLTNCESILLKTIKKVSKTLRH